MHRSDEKVVVIGAGGHAKVVVEALRRAKFSIMGFTAPNGEIKAQDWEGLTWLGDDAALKKLDPKIMMLCNGIGSIGNPARRREVYANLRSAAFHFVRLIHPSAVVPESIVVGEGAQVMAGVVIQPGTTLGENVIINTGAIIDHDCVISDHAHVAPGCTLSGGVVLGEGAHIGSGATIIQGIRIGSRALIAAGAVVVADVPPGARVAGVPAKSLGS